MLEKVSGNLVLSKTHPCKWYKTFMDGRQIVEDMPRPTSPITSSLLSSFDFEFERRPWSTRLDKHEFVLE